jgi:hypothetical protein
VRAGQLHATLALCVLALLALAGPAQAEPRVVDLSIKKGELPKEQRTVTVRQGDDVTLRWATDQALTIHLHGYDLEQKLTPGTLASMRFAARATGRFAIEIHAHGSGKERVIGYLEVHPR